MIEDQQVRLLMQEIRQKRPLATAAAKAGMSERTARKWRDSGKLPSERRAAHDWRTREDPFAVLWPEVEALLAADPGLQAKAVFEELQRRHLLYFYLFRHDFSNSHRPEALWISHFDSLLQKVISPCRGGEGPSPVHLESPQGTVCRPS